MFKEKKLVLFEYKLLFWKLKFVKQACMINYLINESNFLHFKIKSNKNLNIKES